MRRHPLRLLAGIAATRIIVSGTDEAQLHDEATLLAGELVALDQLHELSMDHTPETVIGAEPAGSSDIVLRLGAVENLSSAEAYKLVVDDSVTITGSSDAGVFYGTRTLLQSLASSGGVQCATVIDEPAKPERSLHVDAARKYYSPRWFEQVIRDMSSIKLNQLQYHFSENEGFRLESKTHPEIPSDQYLTQDELTKLLILAAQYHVEVVPALDVPGHLAQVLNEHHAFRAFNSTEGRKVVDYSKPEARALMFELIDELAPLFPGSRWHMGGDEIFNVEDASDPGTRFPQLPSLGKDRVRVWNEAL